MLHKTLRRQLRKVGASEEAPPADAASWRTLLGHVDRAYTEADQDRYTLQRSMAISSEEMRGLYSRIEQDLNRIDALMRALDEGVLAFDGQGRITLINDAARRALMLDSEDQAGCALWDAFTLLDNTSADDAIARVLTPGALARWLSEDSPSTRGEARVRRADGAERDMAWSLSRVQHSGGVIGGVLAFHDITDRKAAEEAIRQSEQRLKLYVRQTPLAAVEMDPDGVVTRWNHAAEKMFGYIEREAVGRSIFDLIVPAHLREEARTTFRSNLNAGSTRRSHENITRDGKIIICEWFATTLLDADGAVIGAAAMGQDITARTQYERKLEQARRHAEQTSRAKTSFLANMSHEIRTPMTAILGFADLLSDPDLAPDARDEAIDTIRRNGDHLLKLINDILDISKIEEGRMETERIECSVREIIHDVVSLMRIRAEEKGIELTSVITPDVPERMVTDPMRLRQIITNLVGNSIKFTERGSVHVEASMRFDDPDKFLSISVSDTGLGMTAEQIKRVFEPFAQADTSTTRRFGGAGLGLAISRFLAGMLGGDIEIQSTPGVGSTLTVTVSATMVATARQRDAVPERRASDAPQAVSLRGRVLLAEDGPDNQRLIAHILRKHGAEVEIAHNGRVACEMAMEARGRGEPYDLILMDMQMPEMDGYTASGELRTQGHETPIVALTAHAMEGDRERCLAAGCDDYITKPVNKAEFLSVCGRWMRCAHAA